MNLKATCLPLPICTALILLVAMLACGPSDESSPPEEQPSVTNQSEEATSTPTPTPTQTPAEKYPKLDPTLQQIVGEFDTGEITEAEAAKKAPVYDGHLVLTATDVPASNINTLDTWMEEQEIAPRYTVTVMAPPRGFVGQGGTPPKPRLPQMKGYPYPKLKGRLHGIVYEFEHGGLTAEQAAQKGMENQGTSIRVSIQFSDHTQVQVTAAWLKSEGVQDSALDVYDSSILAYIPVPLLGELSTKPGVLAVRTARRPAGAGSRPQKPTGQAQPPAPPPTIVSQGVAAHHATRWPSAYDGTGVKVGIIDIGFNNFVALRNAGELPGIVQVKQRCYDSGRDRIPSNIIAECTGDPHGSTVAEALVDVVDGATLYISNAMRLDDDRLAMTRLKEDVKWMIGEGVDVINYSVYWGLHIGVCVTASVMASPGTRAQ